MKACSENASHILVGGGGCSEVELVDNPMEYDDPSYLVLRDKSAAKASCR